MVNHSIAASDFDTVFSALSNSTRRAILQRLTESSATVSELAEQFTISLPAISRHLRVLEKAGLLRQRKKGRARHCYLVVEPLAEASEWLDQYRLFWENSFDSLDELLEQTDS